MKHTLAALFGTLGAVAISTSARADEVVISNLSLLEQLSRGVADEISTTLEVDPSTPITIISTTPHEGNAFVKRILAETLAARGYHVTVARSAGEIDTVSAPASANTPPGRTPPRPPGAPPDSAPDDTTKALANGGVPPEKSAAEPVGAISSGGGPTRPFQVTGGGTLPLGAYPDGVTLDLQLLEFGVQYSEVGRRFLVGSVSFTRVAGVYAQVSVLDGPHGELRDVLTAQRHHWDRVAGRQRVLAEGVAYPYSRPELNAPGLGNYVEPAVVVGIVGSLIYLFYANQN
jgi:hypothetical protein